MPRRNASNVTIDSLLQSYNVLYPEELAAEKVKSPSGWFAVSEGKRIRAFFKNVRDARRWRLTEIARLLNDD
jgi:hypothetical protein